MSIILTTITAHSHVHGSLMLVNCQWRAGKQIFKCFILNIFTLQLFISILYFYDWIIRFSWTQEPHALPTLYSTSNCFISKYDSLWYDPFKIINGCISNDFKIWSLKWYQSVEFALTLVFNHWGLCWSGGPCGAPVHVHTSHLFLVFYTFASPVCGSLSPSSLLLCLS